MVLAGIVLKLAVYLIMRVLIPLLPEATAYFTPFLQSLALITIIMGSLITIRQTDVKCLVAYSSVVHMAVVCLGIFSNDLLGIEGAYILSLAHGLVSPALFFIVGSILYDYYGTRIIRYYRGLANYAPLLSLFFGFFTFANMSTPLTINFVGEFLCLYGATANHLVVGLLGSSGILLSACYGI
jgi:NADH-ubiquinone oxidoreductase chain 4